MDNNIKSSNRMSAKQLVIKENAELEFRRNKNTGKLFFTCGNKAGYISPAAAKKFTEGNASLDDFQYAEVSINGQEAVPCLMIVGNSKASVVGALGAELLH